MAEPAIRRAQPGGSDQSIGDLVSTAARDISQLVRFELDLAKIELKDDVKRLAIGGALLAIGGFVACLVLVLLCFAFAFGLAALGIWLWAAFLIVAGTCVLLTGLAALIGITLVRRMTGMSKTRHSVAEGVSMLRRLPHRDPGSAPSGAKANARVG
ncbi:MAG TPA: phage holin family protein [Streptosporangiaceae bacterium]|nr:phage holin family protein [Streptosporangiaceae bacterium]